MQNYTKIINIFLGLIILFLVLGSLYLYFTQTNSASEEILDTNTQSQSLKAKNSNPLKDLFDKNDFVNAHKMVDKNLAKDPKSLRYLLDKASVYAQEASLTYKENELGNKAKELLEQVLQQDENNIEALGLMGYVHEIQQNYVQAHKYYDAALKLDPNFVKILDQKGHAYELVGDFTNALKFYELALTKDNSYLKSLNNLGRLYLLTGQYSKAEKILSNRIELTDNIRDKAEMYYMYGTMKEDLEKYSPEAEKYYRLAVATDPSLPLAYVGLAKEEFKNGQYENSFANLSKALELNPNQSGAVFQLALQYYALEDKVTAIAILEKLQDNVDKDITLNATNKKIMKEAVKIALENFKE